MSSGRRSCPQRLCPGSQCGVFEDVPAASVILDDSTRLTEVVDGILTLTRMDQLRYQVVPVELAVNGFIEERLECLEGFAYSKNIKLVFQPGEEHKIITTPCSWSGRSPM